MDRVLPRSKLFCLFPLLGMDSEFAVYSQWRDDSVSHDDSDIMDHRNLADSDLMTIAQVSRGVPISGSGFKIAGSGSFPSFKSRVHATLVFSLMNF